ncbi:MAG: hypothetical protein ACLP2X_05005, partial [Syntrophobacteraceae bacterium]
IVQEMCRLTSLGKTRNKARLRLAFHSTADRSGRLVLFLWSKYFDAQTVARLRSDRLRNLPSVGGEKRTV